MCLKHREGTFCDSFNAVLHFKTQESGMLMLLIAALEERGRCIHGQSGQQGELQDSQSSVERPCLSFRRIPSYFRLFSKRKCRQVGATACKMLCSILII